MTRVNYDPEEEERDVWDRVWGYVMNALAGVGMFAISVFLAIVLGYWTNK